MIVMKVKVNQVIREKEKEVKVCCFLSKKRDHYFINKVLRQKRLVYN